MTIKPFNPDHFNFKQTAIKQYQVTALILSGISSVEQVQKLIQTDLLKAIQSLDLNPSFTMNNLNMNQNGDLQVHNFLENRPYRLNVAQPLTPQTSVLLVGVSAEGFVRSVQHTFVSNSRHCRHYGEIRSLYECEILPYFEERTLSSYTFDKAVTDLSTTPCFRVLEY